MEISEAERVFVSVNQDSLREIIQLGNALPEAATPDCTIKIGGASIRWAQKGNDTIHTAPATDDFLYSWFQPGADKQIDDPVYLASRTTQLVADSQPVGPANSLGTTTIFELIKEAGGYLYKGHDETTNWDVACITVDGSWATKTPFRTSGVVLDTYGPETTQTVIISQQNNATIRVRQEIDQTRDPLMVRVREVYRERRLTPLLLRTALKTNVLALQGNQAARGTLQKWLKIPVIGGTYKELMRDILDRPVSPPDELETTDPLPTEDQLEDAIGLLEYLYNNEPQS